MKSPAESLLRVVISTGREAQRFTDRGVQKFGAGVNNAPDEANELCNPHADVLRGQ